MLSVTVCVQTRIFRDGLVSALLAESGIANVSECASIDQLLKLQVKERADVVLLDVQSCHGGKDATAEVRKAHAACERCAIVALGLDTDDDTIASLLEAGAAGYVTTRDSIEDLMRVLFAASNGELYCTPRVMRIVQLRLVQTCASESERSQGGTRLASLSRREKQVLELVRLGRSNKEIARELCVELATVKNHMHSVLYKLHVRTRHEAVSVLGAA